MLFCLLQGEEYFQNLYQINSHDLLGGIIRYNICREIKKIRRKGRTITRTNEGEKHPENTQIYRKFQTQKTKKQHEGRREKRKS